MLNATQSHHFGFGTQIRKSPYFDATIRWGATSYSVYNHMYIPRSFGNLEENFWNLVNKATLSDVSVQRQVEITGADAARFVQLLTPRNLSSCAVGQCKYILVTNAQGGILNDPVLLRLAENHFWLSLSDSDILLWAQGVAANSSYDVHICEPDVSPLQLQGPLSRDIMSALFGETIRELKYYRLAEFNLQGIPLIISRTGWSSELGYEIYLRDSNRADELWEHIMKVGQPMGLKPGHTSAIRRIEGGMLSYHADMDANTNPFELGLERLVDLEMEADFIGKKALQEIAKQGVSRKQVGIEIYGEMLIGANNEFWQIVMESMHIGYVTSAIYSPRLQKNIALAMVHNDYSEIGLEAELHTPFGQRGIKIVPKPFYDPKKKLAVVGSDTASNNNSSQIVAS
jgi:glycine cleavage system aminomethyltransferase T